MNVLFFRRFFYRPVAINEFVSLLKKLKVEYLIFSGDMTSTSQMGEYEMARNFFLEIEKNGIKILFIPGNHDHYTKKAFINKRFYNFFENLASSSYPDFCLKYDGVEIIHLKENWWYVGIDTTVATSLLSSRGLFSHDIEDSLIEALKIIPKDNCIIMANHYPFFKNENTRKSLKRGHALKKILEKNPNIKLYLHGHTHRQRISDFRKNGLPIILDSGSLSNKKKMSFNVIDLYKHSCEITLYQKPKKKSWKVKKNVTFEFENGQVV